MLRIDDARTHLVINKGCIWALVRLIIDTSMLVDCLAQVVRIRQLVADMASVFLGGFPLHLSCRFDHRKVFHVGLECPGGSIPAHRKQSSGAFPAVHDLC